MINRRKITDRRSTKERRETNRRKQSNRRRSTNPLVKCPECDSDLFIDNINNIIAKCEKCNVQFRWKELK